MSMLRTLRRLDRQDRRLLRRALLWVIAIRLGLTLFSFQRLLRWSERRGLVRKRPPAVSPRRAAWAIGAVARRLPGTRCLARSLALKGLLAQAGIASDLRIGVSRSGRDGLDAHAWIEHDGHPLGESEDVTAYTPMPLPSPPLVAVGPSGR
jgi:hypothetical protein